MAHYHVIGIGGSGMSAIAHVLLDQGHTVSGCDQQRNALTEELGERGAPIFVGHDAAHLNGVDIVATSSALKPDHPELVAARERGIPVQKRADLWREWSLQKPTLAIAGTHGKTTTTAMCAVILQELGYDPAYIVPAGGPVPGLQRFARWGSGPFVIEADEYDRLFLGLIPTVSIITSVDWDHVDIYPTRESVQEAFEQFMNQTAQTAVVCSDDAGVLRLMSAEKQGEQGPALVIPYGNPPAGEWQPRNIRIEEQFTVFDVVNYGADTVSATARIRVPGLHNVQNALGAIIGVWELVEDVSLEAICEALATYRGAARRFEWKGEAGGVTVIDDYAHNPPKIRSAISAARMRYPDRRLVVYVQPHTYSRTQALIDEFATAFEEADVLLIGDIYPSREKPIDFPGIDAAYLASQVTQPAAIASGDVEQSAWAALAIIKPDDVLLTLGAGDGNRVGERILERLSDKATR